MKLSHSAALWIFELLGLDPAFVGDLLEERARGRSLFWYWKQVLAAVWVGIWSAIFEHKLLALRAVATGCAVNSVWLFLHKRFLHIGLPGREPFFTEEAIVTLLIILVALTVTGWVIARTHRPYGIPMVFVFGLWLALWYLPSVVFPVGRFQYVRGLLVDSIDHPEFRPYLLKQLVHLFRELVWICVPILTELAGLFAGGVVAARPTTQPSTAAPK